MLFVVQLPADTVFGRILPALAIALPLGNLFYAYLAYQLAKKEGRDDVAAMPYGPTVPHYFFVTFVIMLPVLGRTGDVMQAWQAGLAWAFLIGVIVLIGAFIGPTIRKYTPRAAMLGTLAGISLAFISMSASFEMFNAAWIALATFAIILLSWTAGVRLPFGIPGGLAAIIVGSVIGWLSYVVFGWTGLSPQAVDGLLRAGRAPPARSPGSEVLSGLTDILPAPRHRDPARRLQLHRGHEQRRVRLRRRRQLQPPPHPAGRRDRRGRRVVPRQPVPARRLHRPSGLEGRRRPDRLLARDRDRHRA